MRKPKPRKFTFERNRERAIEILELYEAGMTPKQICERLDLPIEHFWQKIKTARRARDRAAENARAE